MLNNNIEQFNEHEQEQEQGTEQGTEQIVSDDNILQKIIKSISDFFDKKEVKIAIPIIIKAVTIIFSIFVFILCRNGAKKAFPKQELKSIFPEILGAIIFAEGYLPVKIATNMKYLPKFFNVDPLKEVIKEVAK